MVDWMADSLRHHSDSYFALEGFKEQHVFYQCRYCNAHLTIAVKENPHDKHPCPKRQEAAI